jgi:hypothetical protein
MAAERAGGEDEGEHDLQLARLLGPVIFRVSMQQGAVDRDFTDRPVDGALGTAER